MADSAVVVTAGTGTNIDTRTEGTNGHHRQVVVLGDPATNAGVAPVDATAGLKVDLGADNDVVVSATDLDIRDLAKASDSVTAAIENIHEANFDSGAGTDTTPAIGIAVPASGGAAVITGDTTNGLDVDVTRSALPSGAATSAKQDTIIGHLDGVETVLGTIDTDTGNISTKIDTIAGAVSGTEMQVDVLTMPSVAVTNGGLTELAAAINASSQMDVNIAANGIGLATSAKQDTIIGHVDGIEGLLTTIDSDTSELAAALNASNQMDVNIAASGATVPVSNAGLTELAAAINSSKVDVNIVSSDVATGGTSAADDADFTAGTTPGTPSMGVYESTPTTVTDGDLGVVGITSGRRLKTSATIDAALPAGTNAIGKLAANSGVDIGDVDILSIAAGDNNIGNVDVVTLPATPAGTNAIGKLLPPDIDVTTHTNYAKKYYTNAGAVTDGIIWSPAAGKRWHVVALHIQVSAAATVTLEDDKAGGDEVIFKAEYAANGGEFLVFPEKYPLASGEDAADLLITTSAGNVYVTAVGYEI